MSQHSAIWVTYFLHCVRYIIVKKVQIFAKCSLRLFVLNMSFKFPGRSFEPINFHLLRHLALLCETFGPLWTTSASLFESTNHFLIRPDTGFVNTCKLLAQRYIRNKDIVSSSLKDNFLKPVIENKIGRIDFVNQTLGLISTTIKKKMLQQFPSARVFCCYWGKFRLDSESLDRYGLLQLLYLNQRIIFSFDQLLVLWILASCWSRDTYATKKLLFRVWQMILWSLWSKI